ncbi:hypothetical protein Bca101_037237 [Brassica carinata]
MFLLDEKVCFLRVFPNFQLKLFQGPAPVPLEFFSFCLYEQLMELANKNTQFLGIIGEVTQGPISTSTKNFGEDGVTSSASYTKYGDVQKIETVTVLKLNAYVLKSRCRYCPAASVADPLESEGTGSGDVQLNPTCPLTTTTGAEEHTGVGSSAEEPHVSSAERELKKAHKA